MPWWGWLGALGGYAILLGATAAVVARLASRRTGQEQGETHNTEER